MSQSPPSPKFVDEKSALIKQPDSPRAEVDSEASDSALTSRPPRQLPSLHMFLLLAILFLIFLFNCTRRRKVYLSSPSPTALQSSLIPASTTRGLNRTASIRLLSLNTFIRPFLVGVNDHKDDRLLDLLDILRGYDLTCFQELFWTAGPRKAAFLSRIAERYGLIYTASSPVPGISGLLRFPPKVIDAGLVIASRYPIVAADYHTYGRAVSTSIDYIVGKGVLYARVSLFAEQPQRFVHVFTTHMQANNGLHHAPFDKVRALQLRELVDFVRRKTEDDPNGVVMLTGDFNVDARSAFDDASSSDQYKSAMNTLQSFRSGIPVRDLLYEASRWSHPVTTAGGLDGSTQKNERLDYIFLSSSDAHGDGVPLVATPLLGSVRVEELRKDGGGARKEAYNTISDHYAIRAEIVCSEARLGG